MRRTSLSSIRWGAKLHVEVPADAGGGVPLATVDQFLEFSLPTHPVKLALALYAITQAAPPPALIVNWTVSWGNGSMNHDELFSLAPTRVDAQVPILLERPAQTIQVVATISNIGAPAVIVDLVAMSSPLNPMPECMWIGSAMDVEQYRAGDADR